LPPRVAVYIGNSIVISKLHKYDERKPLMREIRQEGIEF
jgi:hypothetical protein